jgi:two-component system response regulator RegX3
MSGADGHPPAARRLVVLVVEDEESYVDALTTGLEREGFTVEVAHDGLEALDRFDVVQPDLVLLDLMLPKLSGVEVCRQLRARSAVPVIMVTAKDSEIDTVVGLELGADDYVAKPYRLRELVARIRSVLRRSAPPDPVGHLADDGLEVGDVRLDRERHEVTVRGAEVRFPLKEFELLEALMSRAGRVCTRELLLDQVWGLGYGDSKTLDVHVKRLRAKVEDDPTHPRRITTVRGLGYRYELPGR